jgi:hypothetical protein
MRMRTSAHIPPGGLVAAPRWTDVLLAWSDADDDATAAYLAWRDADRSGEADAFVVYRAALDREEAAARALQSVTTASA